MNKRMMKLHEEALYLVHSKDKLTDDEREFVINNYLAGGSVNNHARSAFFTPWDLACDFDINATGFRKVIDLCAGIGVLSLPLHFRSLWDRKGIELVCVESCYEYVEVGKKVLPEATWIHGDVTDPDLISSLGHFELAISNPPFGNNVKPTVPSKHYKGNDFEYTVIDIASEIADHGAFIIPRHSSPFVMSGPRAPYHINDHRNNEGDINLSHNAKKYIPFQESTLIELEYGVAFDCDAYLEGWKGVRPLVEAVTADFIEVRKARKRANEFPGLTECPLFQAA